MEDYAKMVSTSAAVDAAKVQAPQPTQRAFGVVIVVVIVVLCTVAFILLVCMPSSRVAKPRATSQQANRNRRLAMRLSRSMPESKGCDADSLPPLAPLWWDVEEGAYVLQLRIGQSTIELVLDSGSGQITAKGDDCQWIVCEGTQSGECETKACGCGTDRHGNVRTECGIHRYKPSGIRLNPGERGAGNYTTLSYGSQENHITHYMEHLKMEQLHLRCADVPTTAPPEHLEGGDKMLDLGEVIVHSAHRIEGTSNSNIMGLSMPSKDKQGDKVVIDHLFKNGKPAIWSVVFRKKSGWWALGPLSCFKNISYVPLLDPPEFRSFLTKFYIIQLSGVWVGTNPNALHKVDEKRTPKYCIVDTGTTYTYGPTSLGEAMLEKGWNDQTNCIRFDFGPPDHLASLTFSPEQHKDPDGVYAQAGESVISVTPGKTLDDFEEIFGNTPVLMLGATLMCDAYWEHDVHNMRLGIQLLPSQ